MFYIENNVLVCVLFDVERVIMHDRMFSDINHMNRVLIPMNVFDVHELQDREMLKNLCHIHYICMYRFRQFLLRLRFFRIFHLCLMKKDLRLLVKVNYYNIERQENISDDQLNQINWWRWIFTKERERELIYQKDLHSFARHYRFYDEAALHQ